MRRLAERLFLAAVAVAAVCLATGCGSAIKGAIASLSPSRTASFTPTQDATITPTPTAPSTPTPSVTVTPTPSVTVTVTPTTAPPTQPVSTPAQTGHPKSSPAPSSGSSSNLVWLWAVLGAVVLVIVIAWVIYAARRRRLTATAWESRVTDTYAKGSVLYDAMSVAETPGGLAAADAGARWSDIQRRADDLAQMLYGLREAARDEDDRARVADVIASLRAVRSAMEAERVPGGAGPQHAEVVRRRLFSFEQSLRALQSSQRAYPA